MTEPENLPGLTEKAAQARLQLEGFNELPNYSKRGFLRILLEVLREPMFALLLAGALVYLLLGDSFEAIILLVFACLSVGITLIQEYRSERLLDSLRDLSAPRARVMRDGVPVYIASREVVRGDILLISEGDRIAADATVFDAQDLLVDESLLTGESIPVTKTVANICSESLADSAVKSEPEKSIVYAGTLVVKGSAQVSVFATGLQTELGKIGGSLAGIDIEQPHLKKQIHKLVTYSAIAGALVAALAILLFALLRGSWLEAMLAGIAIGMSMIPEEFPLVIAVFMAMGAWRISRAGVLTRRLAAIETLGSTTVLCSDKTGTLTENSMSVVAILGENFRWEKGQPFNGSNLGDALQVGLLASAKIPIDPMDLAIHKLAVSANIYNDSRTDLQHSLDLRPDFFAVVNIYYPDVESTATVFTKGAFEAIALLCKLPPEKMALLTQEVNQLAAQGMRVLALAKLRNIPCSDETVFRQSIQQYHFEYCGLIGFADPLRDEIPAAIRDCQTAGIKVVMITGDHPVTATAIAQQAGIPSKNFMTGDDVELASNEKLAQLVQQTFIYARIRPQQKLRIVNALKTQGEVVAMTGDGVNDAPAIKAAHVGVAMGMRGTEVAREAAALVLLDDNFASIVKAIRLGRRIYDNLRKSIEYIIAAHIPIAGLALAPLLLGLPLMLTPINIAFLEMIIDTDCSIAFEAEPEEARVMQRPPRNPQSPMIASRQLLWSLAQGFLMLASLLVVLIVGFRAGIAEAELRGLVFAQLVLMNLALIFINRSFNTSFKSTFALSNKVLWLQVSFVSLLLFLSLCWIPLQQLFHFGAVHTANLIACLMASLITIFFLGYLKIFFRPNLEQAFDSPSVDI